VQGSNELENLEETTDESDRDFNAARAGERPVVQLVDRILAEGIQSRASDIH
jgi:type II secretory ATPase GspE/PulE/Tfp pilus assembly ATPase PilB-like protein